MSKPARDLLVAAVLVTSGTVAIVGNFLALNGEIAHQQSVNSTSHTRPLAAQGGE